MALPLPRGALVVPMLGTSDPERRCVICPATLPPAHLPGPPRRYCSQACRSEAYRRRLRGTAAVLAAPAPAAGVAGIVARAAVAREASVPTLIDEMRDALDTVDEELGQVASLWRKRKVEENAVVAILTLRDCEAAARVYAESVTRLRGAMERRAQRAAQRADLVAPTPPPPPPRVVARQGHRTPRPGTTRARVLTALRNGERRLVEIHAAVGGSRNSLTVLLCQMAHAGEVERVARGVYALP